LSPLRCLLLGLFLVAVPSSALASIEHAKALKCSGGGEAFTVIFDHDEEQAKVADHSGTRSYAYRQGDAFLTWRLLDEAGRQHYLIRQGDAINGDLGWYFTSFVSEPAGGAELTNSGTCSTVE